jgi:signal peptidase II
MNKKILHNLILKLLIIAIIVIIDLITKIFLDNKYIDVIDGVLSFKSTHNTGAAWSILSEHTWILIVITIIFLVGFIYYDISTLKKNKSFLYTISFSMILGGAIGNLIDRIFLGYVRDFICLDFMNFPIFNFADIMLVIGVILLAIFILFFNNGSKQETNVLLVNENKPKIKIKDEKVANSEGVKIRIDNIKDKNEN